ncbi:MAG: DUF1802 family protein [Planctomycetes bacterium]|nr:DUF1802 family protein [Planctomycetota bacterium]
MLPENHIAFKEWAVVCAALGSGMQSLILRKGGIHEGRDGFRVAHAEFWLYPTYLHESAPALIAGCDSLLAQAEATRPDAGLLDLALYAVVHDVYEVRDEQRLAQLAGQHIWSAETVAQRFHYRTPGLFALAVEIRLRPVPYRIAESPDFSGCRSWVELPVALSTHGLQPVLPEVEFTRRRNAIRAALTE